MLFCLPLAPLPCFHYTGENREELNAFLLAHGGQPARFDESGRADIVSQLKSGPRPIYCKPGAWLRLLAPAQFTACSDKLFREHYSLVETASSVLNK